MKTAYLALGSNLGDRAANLSRALEALGRDRATALLVTNVSSVYETAPVGKIDQPDFYNLAAEVSTTLSAPELMTRCLEVEAELGRVRHELWGPRTIDIDLLSYEEERITSEFLSLPHPRMLERAFVLIPLAEIAPQLVLAGETVAARVSMLGPAGIERVGRLADLAG